MNKEQVEMALRKHFEVETMNVKPALNWWSTLRSRLNLRHEDRSRGIFPRTKLAWLFVILLLPITGGVVFGTSFLIKDMFQKYAPAVEESGLATELDLSQTIDGVTVRVERAYADSANVILGFTLAGPGKFEVSPTLVTGTGQELPVSVGMGEQSGTNPLLGTWGGSNSLAMLYTFDARGVGQDVSNLDLVLKVQVSSLSIFGSNTGLVGNYAFNFSVPFYGGKVVKIGQTVDFKDISFTLDRILISNSGTRAFLGVRLGGQYVDINGRASLVSLQPGDNQMVGASTTHEPKGALEAFFKTDLTSVSGEWVLTITEVVFPPQHLGHGNPEETLRVSGPWVFRFEVP